MTTATWIAGTGNWTTGTDWNTGNAPGPGDAAVIPFGTVQLTTPVTVNSIALSTSAGTLQVADPGQVASVATTLSNSGTVSIDASSSGSTLSIGGTLTNSGAFTIGNSSLTAASTVNAGGLSNTGTINLTGNGSNQAALNIGAAAPATLSGTYDLQDSAALLFASGGITGIASGASLTLNAYMPSTNTDNGQVSVGICGNPASNGALAGLASNAGTLNVYVGETLTTNAGINFTNTGNLNVEYGSSVTLGGTLTNSGTVFVSDSAPALSPSPATTLTVAGLNNTGTIDVESGPDIGGNFGGQATLDVTGPAPPVLNGSIVVLGNALLEFGSGSINTIAASASLELLSYGASEQARIVGISGLTSNAGMLVIDPASGRFADGGTQVALGSLSNSGTIAIGNVNDNRGLSSLTLAGLTNTGTITLVGGATLDVQSAAPTTLTGNISIGANSLLEYASGGITAIGSGASLTLAGGFLAVSSNTNGNTALTNLAINAGTFILAGSSLATGVTFNNSGTLSIVQGVFAPGGALNNSGTVSLGQSTILSLTGSNTYSQTAGSTTVNGGALSTSQIDIGGGTLLFDTALTSSAGTGTITIDGGVVEFAAAADAAEKVSFAGSGTLRVDDASQFAATIVGFTAAGDVTDLPNLIAVNTFNGGRATEQVSFNSATDQLTVTVTGGEQSGAVTLQLANGNYAGVNWVASQDGSGGTRVEVTPQPAPSGLALAAGSQTGNPTTTDLTTPTIVGFGDPGDTVTLYDSAGALGSATVAGNGGWSTVTSPFVQGSYALTASESDNFGDSSPPSAALDISVVAPPDTSDSIVFRSTDGTGTVNVWPIADGVLGPDGVAGSAVSAWQIVGTGDFFGQGSGDIVWHNSNGQVDIWNLVNGQHTADDIISGADPSQWQLVTTGDFFGTGTDDLAWQNTVNGTVDIWQMQNGQHVADDVVGSADPSQWQIVGTGDFFGTGTDDIMFRNTVNGTVDIWQMQNGQHVADDFVGSADPSQWQIVGIGDFYGTGTDDILWRNTINGNADIWQMQNGQHVADNLIGGAPPSWQVQGTGDFFGTGTDAIVWRNSQTGTVDLWQMQNGQHTADDIAGSTAASWTIQPSGHYVFPQ